VEPTREYVHSVDPNIRPLTSPKHPASAFHLLL
jgi:hypothetical protein